MILKKIVWIALLVCVWTVTVKGQEKTVPYESQLKQVENFLAKGDLNTALETLNQITDKYPEAPDVYYGKAILNGQLRNYEGALSNARKAYSQQPSELFANYIIDLYKSANNWEDLADFLETVRKDLPGTNGVGRELILAYAKQKAFDKALDVYEKERTDNNGQEKDDLHVAMAEAYIWNEEYAKAKTILSPLDGKSKFPMVYSTLGYLLMKEKNYKQAIELYNRALKTVDAEGLNILLAEAYLADNKKTLSFVTLKKAFESPKVDFGAKYRVMFGYMNPENRSFSETQLQELANILVLNHPREAESHVFKGELLWRKRNLKEARSLFLTAVGINPHLVDAWRMLVNVDLGLNDVESAILHSEEALKANPQNPMLMYFAGLAFMVDEDYENSRAMLEMALDHSDEERGYLTSLIYSGLGDLYHKLKMDAESDVAYEEAIRLDSTNASAMNNLAYYLSVRKKDLDKAAAYSKLSNEITPDFDTYQDTYAWVLFQQGKYSEALVWIEKAIKGGSNSAVLYEHYGDILSKVGKTKEAIKQWQKALALANGDSVDEAKIKTKIKEQKYVE